MALRNALFSSGSFLQAPSLMDLLIMLSTVLRSIFSIAIYFDRLGSRVFRYSRSRLIMIDFARLGARLMICPETINILGYISLCICSEFFDLVEVVTHGFLEDHMVF